MSISSISSSSLATLLGSDPSTSDVSGASTVIAQALAKINQRIQTDQTSTTAQLSSFGLLKSALSASQGSAQALTNLTSSTSTADATTAMANFFNDYNSTMAAAANTAAVPGSDSAAQSATRVSRDMQWALNSQPAVIDAMKTVGLTLQSDGTLQQDAKKFAAALSSDPTGTQQAMATIGNAINAAATQELGSSGAVGTAIDSLNQHNTTLAAEQQAMANLATQTGVSSATSSTSTDGTGSAASATTSTTGSSASTATGTSASGLTPEELNALISPSSSTSSTTGFLGYGLSAYQANSTGY